MRIAICDDDLQLCNSIKYNIYEYANNHNWEPVVDIYSSGEEIVKTSIKYDIVFMDYQMDGIDGLETAKILRNGANALSCIIFLTNYPQIAISAYEVDTYRFIVKETLFDSLFKALDDYRKSNNQDIKLEIKAEHSTFTINTSDILFVEVMDKLLLIHLTDGNVLKTRATLNKFSQKLPEASFVKIHKSFIVNLRYIGSYVDNCIKIHKYSLELPISRTYLKEFRHKYKIYLRDLM